MTLYNQPPDPREGCFKNTAIIAVVILVSIIVLVMVIRSDAQPVASVARETYVKPDSCFWEEVEISPKITNLYLLLRVMEARSCARFVYSPMLVELYEVKIRNTSGPVLQILEDAIRGTDLAIEVFPPYTVGVYRRKEEGL
jgi:hypothetical protein